MRRWDSETVWDVVKLAGLAMIVVVSIVAEVHHMQMASKCEHRGGIYVRSYSGWHYYCAAGRR